MNRTFVVQMERANGFLCKGHQEIISLKRCFLISERRDFKGVVLFDSKHFPFQTKALIMELVSARKENFVTYLNAIFREIMASVCVLSSEVRNFIGKRDFCVSVCER